MMTAGHDDGHPVQSPLTVLTLAELRQRRSAKWRTYPADVLPLWIAETDTPLAEPIREALATAVARGDTGYVHEGRLAEAYASFAGRRFGWSPELRQLRMMPDVMQGIVEVLRVVTGPGDAVVINPPVYPPFFAYLSSAERRLVEVPLAAHDSGAYHLDLDGLERAFAAGAGAFLLCNPHNPTGTAFARDELLAVAELAQRYGVRVLVDEIHSPLTYPGVRHVPFLSLLDRPLDDAGGSEPWSAEGAGAGAPQAQAAGSTGPAAEGVEAGESGAAGGAAATGLAAEGVAQAFALVSASKAWNLPGVKAALAVAGPAATADLARIPAEVRYGADLFGVIAAEAALVDGLPWLGALLAGLDANRTLLGRLLAELLPEVRYRPPDATYLAWLDCRRLGLGDDPAAAFLERGRVALHSGHEFGGPGRGFVRLNFATAPQLLTEAVRRMASVVNRSAGR